MRKGSECVLSTSNKLVFWWHKLAARGNARRWQEDRIQQEGVEKWRSRKHKQARCCRRGGAETAGTDSWELTSSGEGKARFSW
eukprot:3902017-Rhodomonas_salina.1